MTLSGQTKRGDMTSGNLDLFKMALGLEDPSKVTRTDFNPEGGRLDLYLDIPRGARFSCPVDGCGQEACPGHDARAAAKLSDHGLEMGDCVSTGVGARRLVDLCRGWLRRAVGDGPADPGRRGRPVQRSSWTLITGSGIG